MDLRGSGAAATEDARSKSTSFIFNAYAEKRLGEVVFWMENKGEKFQVMNYTSDLFPVPGSENSLS
jgi:hypothetical protein